MEYRVVLIKTPDPRGITESLINGLNRVFISKGFKTKIVEPTPENIQNVVNEIYEFNPLFMFDFNLDGVIYGEKDGKKVPLADIMGNLHMSWFFDDPMVHWIKLKPILNSTQMVYLTIDIEHSQWLGSLGKNVAFLSPGIVPENIPSPKTEKEFDVAFVGPVIDPTLIENDWKQRFDEHLYIYAVELGRMLYRNPDIPIRFGSGYLLSQFNQQFQEAMLNLQREKEDEEIPGCFQFFRRKDRPGCPPLPRDPLSLGRQQSPARDRLFPFCAAGLQKTGDHPPAGLG